MEIVEVLKLAVAAVVGAVSFGILFRIPRRYLPHTTVVGFCACLGLGLKPEAWPPRLDVFMTFIVALVVGSLSHGFARWTGKPAQVFLIPGTIILVPGTYIYRAFGEALKGGHEALTLALQAMVISVGISFALLLANWLVPSRKEL